MDNQYLIQLIVQQLQHLGHESVAKVVATELNVDFAFDPSPKLSILLSQALGNSSKATPEQDLTTAKSPSLPLAVVKTEDGTDLQLQQTNQLVFPEATPLKDQPFPIPSLIVSFALPYSIHLCRFSSDGQFLAVATYDSSIRVYDTSTLRSSRRHEDALIKVFNDQCGTIHDLAFHPSNMILASASEDNHIRLYDLSKTAPQRKSFKYLLDSYPVWSTAFHPAGNYLIAGTAHALLRMYDVQTLKCYTPSPTTDVDEISAGGVSNGISSTCVSPNGKLILTASLDGSIKILDAISGDEIQHFKAPHNGHFVSSLEVSRSGAYLLSAGLDGTARLWHISSGRTLKVYYGGSAAYVMPPGGPPSSLCPGPKARFAMGEKHVLNINPAGLVSVWDSITASIVCEFGMDGGTSSLATNQVSPDIVCWNNSHVSVYS